MRFRTKKLILILWIIYSIILTDVIVFKFFGNMEAVFARISKNQRMGIIENMIPFSTLSYQLANIHSDSVALFEILANIGLFVPFSFLFVWAFPSMRSFWKCMGMSIGLSVLFELIQKVTFLGSADIDDVILNGIGAWIGWLLFCFARKADRYFLRRQKKLHKKRYSKKWVCIRRILIVLSILIGIAGGFLAVSQQLGIVFYQSLTEIVPETYHSVELIGRKGSVIVTQPEDQEKIIRFLSSIKVTTCVPEDHGQYSSEYIVNLDSTSLIFKGSKVFTYRRLPYQIVKGEYRQSLESLYQEFLSKYGISLSSKLF